jgi:hypothetical protein
MVTGPESTPTTMDEAPQAFPENPTKPATKTPTKTRESILFIFPSFESWLDGFVRLSKNLSPPFSPPWIRKAMISSSSIPINTDSREHPDGLLSPLRLPEPCQLAPFDRGSEDERGNPTADSFYPGQVMDNVDIRG